MNIHDIITYYNIKLDEHGVKRVQELNVLREHAEMQGDTDLVNQYDQELQTIYQGV